MERASGVIENKSGVAYTKREMFYLRTLPLTFFKFWFLQAPLGLLDLFGSLNSAFLQLFSLPLMLKTYFKPWKNEYREGLVITAIFLGVVIKTVVIFADLILLALLLMLEVIIVISFIFWPVATLVLLFA